MQAVEDILRARFSQAIGLAFGAENITDPLIKPADPRFGDYQVNCAMTLAKTLAQKPRVVAEAIVRHVSLHDMAEPPTLAGPGFINIKLRPAWIARHLTEGFAADPGRCGVDPVAAAQTVVVDYSAPNVAKQMHIGHLRPTVIGDTLARVLELLGHTVVRQNHIGDYGTSFGMLIAFLRRTGRTRETMTIPALDAAYRAASALFRSDPEFAKIARQTVVEFQSGQPEAVALWRGMLAATREHYTEIYQLLNITLTDRDTRGESFYGPRLPRTVEQIKQALDFGSDNAPVMIHAGRDPSVREREADSLGLDTAAAPDEPQPDASATRIEDAAEGPEITKPFAALSDGALCVFLPGYVSKDKRPLPLIVQKSDGGFGYAATDLAALYFRIRAPKTTPEEQLPLSIDWHADRVIYTTDARQKLHFAMVFDTIRAAGWEVNPVTLHRVPLEHAPFGSILGEDNRPFKTRSGDVVPLVGLLHEAIERATAIVREKNPDLSPQRQEAVARAVGIGAVKYADLRQDRVQDYVFSWPRMLSFEGNTGPYLQYGQTRVAGIFRKAGLTREDVRNARHELILKAPQELAVARALLQFGPTVEAVARDLKPHYLCTYLYDLTSTFFSFYDACPVLKAPDEITKFSRLTLCDLIAQTLETGLEKLLGITALEEM